MVERLSGAQTGVVEANSNARLSSNSENGPSILAPKSEFLNLAGSSGTPVKLIERRARSQSDRPLLNGSGELWSLR